MSHFAGINVGFNTVSHVSAKGSTTNTHKQERDAGWPKSRETKTGHKKGEKTHISIFPFQIDFPNNFTLSTVNIQHILARDNNFENSNMIIDW